MSPPREQIAELGPKTNLGDRVAAVKELLNEFKIERTVYVSVIIVSLVLILTSAVVALIKAEFDYATTIGLLGPSGPLVIMTGRLLKMWDVATQIVMKKETHE